MAVSEFFGLPGCGKTTLMTKFAYDAVLSGNYLNVYCNVHLKIIGVTYIPNECIGKYDLSDCLLLIDEATLYADSRDHRNFTPEQSEYFLEHRHFKADVILFTQIFDGVDRQIRCITDRVYYMYKGFFTGRWFSRYYRIPYGVGIHKKGQNGITYGDIVQGYYQPSFFVRLFSPWLYRPKYYQYFDSWEKPYRPPLPSKYRPYIEFDSNMMPITSMRQKKEITKRIILLRWKNRLSEAYRASRDRLSSLWRKISGYFHFEPDNRS